MHIQVLAQSITEVVSDIAIIPVFENEGAELGSNAAVFDKTMDNKILSLIQDGEIQGKFAQTTVIHNFERANVKKTLLVGAGKRNELTGSKIRQLAAV
ncbi:MAG: M17 family peptidase N-terminal domain-containing protein, partial [Bacillota bacterium]